MPFYGRLNYKFRKCHYYQQISNVFFIIYVVDCIQMLHSRLIVHLNLLGIYILFKSLLICIWFLFLLIIILILLTQGSPARSLACFYQDFCIFPHHHHHHQCSAQGQVLHCKIRHQGCNSAQRQFFHCKLRNLGCSFTRDE